MMQADLWCRVLGWLQIVGAAVCGAAIYGLWTVLFGWIEIRNDGFFQLILWTIILFFALPPFLSGLFTVLFANRVEQAREGFRENQSVLLRVVMALCGLWSAGVIGFAGLSAPALGFFAVMGLVSTAIAVMGPAWTADLLRSPEGTS